MIATIHRISSYFFLGLIGIYGITKILILYQVDVPAILFANHATILPMGCMTSLFVFTSVKVELMKRNAKSVFYDLLLILFFMTTITLLIYGRLFISINLSP